jgi:hypothetical protein
MNHILVTILAIPIIFIITGLLLAFIKPTCVTVKTKDKIRINWAILSLYSLIIAMTSSIGVLLF